MTRLSGGLVAFIALALTAQVHGQDVHSGPAARLKRGQIFSPLDPQNWASPRFDLLDQSDCEYDERLAAPHRLTTPEIDDFQGGIWNETKYQKRWLNGPIEKEAYSHDLTQASLFCQVGDHGGLAINDDDFKTMLTWFYCTDSTNGTPMQKVKPVWDAQQSKCINQWPITPSADEMNLKCDCANKKNPNQGN